MKNLTQLLAVALFAFAAETVQAGMKPLTLADPFVLSFSAYAAAYAVDIDLLDADLLMLLDTLVDHIMECRNGNAHVAHIRALNDEALVSTATEKHPQTMDTQKAQQKRDSNNDGKAGIAAVL